MSDPADRRADGPDDDQPGALPPAFREMLRSLGLPEEVPPEVLEMLRGAGLDQVDPSAMAALGAQMRSLFENAPEDGSLSPSTATETARRVVAQTGDPTPTERDRSAAADAVRVADLWLDPVTDLASPTLTGTAWSRAEWVEAAMPTWLDLVEPVADGVSEAVGSALTSQLASFDVSELPEGLVPPGVNPAAAMAQVEPMMRRLHGSLFSLQVRQGVGTLAGELLTGCEVPLPLVPLPTVALLPRAIEEWATGLGIDVTQVRLYLAAREVARARLFAGVPWLEEGVRSAVRDYARDITIDTEAIEEGLRSVDPTDADAARRALEGRLFAPTPSPAQAAALARLETLLALVEGWVDVVAALATRPHLPQVDALAEALRRRRASGGPAEKTFAALVGLELRPRRLRDAANLFAALEAEGGASLRDAAWRHPDLGPSGADLDDPLGYVERLARPATDELDAELDALLRDEPPSAG